MIPPVAHITWQHTYRLINSCYPTCDIWEDIISNSEDWEIAFEIEAMSNPTIRHQLGDISLIPREKMITGPNSWWVISAFTKLNPKGSRFCDGTYGAYYAANNFLTALKEKAFGFTQQFMEATNEEVIDNLQCRVFVGKIDHELHDIRDTDTWSQCYLPDDYTYSQQLGRQLRNQESNGIVYHSVRDKGGQCFAAFWPNVIPIPLQERHVGLHWNGKKIDSYFVIGQKEAKRIPLS